VQDWVARGSVHVDAPGQRGEGRPVAEKCIVDIAAEKARAAEAKAKTVHDTFALQQPEEPPNVNASLVGVRTEVMTRNEEPDEDGVKFYFNQWLPAVVIKLPDGSGKKVGKGEGKS
jgi:hypothetical protein